MHDSMNEEGNEINEKMKNYFRPLSPATVQEAQGREPDYKGGILMIQSLFFIETPHQ